MIFPRGFAQFARAKRKHALCTMFMVCVGGVVHVTEMLDVHRTSVLVSLPKREKKHSKQQKQQQQPNE